MHTLILCSQSPRRHHLLQEAGYEVTSQPLEISENIDKSLNPEAVVRELSGRKVEAWRARYEKPDLGPAVVVGADTVVAEGDEVFGKPKDEEEARRFLRRLSGKCHRVLTGVCFYETWTAVFLSQVEVTWVHFYSLSDSVIDSYVRSGEPLDKAGGYGIQGLGERLVHRIEGSWSNVVGLPMEAFERICREQQWQFSKKQS